MEQSKILVLRSVWIAMLGSTFIYGYVLKMQSANWSASELALDSFAIAFAGVAVLAALASFVLPIVIAKNIKVSPDATQDQKISAYFMPFVLMLVFSEAVALMGFALSILKQNPNYYNPFLAVAALLILIRFPTEDKVNQFLAASQVR